MAGDDLPCILRMGINYQSVHDLLPTSIVASHKFSNMFFRPAYPRKCSIKRGGSCERPGLWFHFSMILIAAGAKLSEVIDKEVYFRGHAIECRINAEHPERFTPSAGKITAFNMPGGTGIRVDTAAYAEGVIPPYYDSLVAKLMAETCDGLYCAGLKYENSCRKSSCGGMFTKRMPIFNVSRSPMRQSS